MHADALASGGGAVARLGHVLVADDRWNIFKILRTLTATSSRSVHISMCMRPKENRIDDESCYQKVRLSSMSSQSFLL